MGGIRYGLEPKNVTPRRGKPSAKWARPLRPDVTPRQLVAVDRHHQAQLLT
jgi:hypothetical protein